MLGAAQHRCFEGGFEWIIRFEWSFRQNEGRTRTTKKSWFQKMGTYYGMTTHGFTFFGEKNPKSKPTHPLWQVETRPLALGLRAPPNLAKARLWDYLFFGCDAGTGDSWEAQFLINWPFNGCKAQLSKNARLSQEVCFWEKNGPKIKKGNEKPGSNTKIPCVFNRSVFCAPCCFKNTM